MRPALVLLALLVAACGPPATLTQVQDEVFTPSCVFSTCHDASANGGLNLTRGKSYSQLVGIAALGAPSKTRVVAGSTAQSYLVEKLTATSPAAGVRMPQGGDPVPAAKLELIRSWIEAGARDD
jgi:hypothetical protein